MTALGVLLSAPAGAGAVYFTLALIAAIKANRRKDAATGFTPPVSILKPIRGRDTGFYEALVSHAQQDYPEFEIVFGVRNADDAALIDIRRVMVEYPNIPMRIISDAPPAPNGKVGMLISLAESARHDVMLVNDSDIRVDQGYLLHVAGRLADPRTGLVTCLYRGRGTSFPARFEALGIATEFMPSVLVARLIGVAEFALGSTMAFRADDLREIGGFESIANYLADDYQLGARIHALGMHIAFADTVVETHLGAGSWQDVWKHQVRWSRTVRVSRTGGYYGAVITHLTFWCVIAALAGAWKFAIACFAIRVVAGLTVAHRVLHAETDWWLIPVRDLWGFAVWVAGAFGNTVEWRGEKLNLYADGRIEP